MLIFPIFAVIVWALTMRWRRRWPAFVIVTVAVGTLLLLTRLLVAYEYLLPRETRLVHELLWPYIGLLALVGYYIACLPRRPGEHACPTCHYDLRGLNPRGLSCPECGAEWRGPGSGHEPPPDDLIPIPKGPPKRREAL